jgi:ATP phosphoribosyltransferase
MLTIALSKGRILEEALPLLKVAGIETLENVERSRKLIFKTNQDDIQLVIIRAADVPTYVEYGAADLGVAGKDVLMEHSSTDLYEPLDLKIAQCRLMIAGLVKANQQENTHRLKVATKYPNITKRFYAEQGVQVDMIKLYGSMELAPLVGLADRIVDLVDTGNTLRANGLAPLELIANISARLVVNKASMKMNQQRIQTIVDRLQSAVNKA